MKTAWRLLGVLTWREPPMTRWEEPLPLIGIVFAAIGAYVLGQGLAQELWWTP